MAKRDRTTWLRLIEYQSVSAFRKRKDYRGIISLREALEVCSNLEFPFLVKILLPYASKPFLDNPISSESVVVYPQFCKFIFEGEGPARTAEIDKPIQFRSKFYSIEQFIKICPKLTNGFEWNSYNIFSFPLNFFMMTSREVNQFESSYLAQVRQMVSKTSLSPDRRGRNKATHEHIADRKQFILKEFESLGSPKRMPLKKIHEALLRYIRVSYGGLDNAPKYMDCSLMTIRRVLKANI